MTAAATAGTPKQGRRKFQMFFHNKHFFLHFRDSKGCRLAEKCVQTFGGMIHTFLDTECVRYLLTDIPKSEWKPDEDGIVQDSILHRAIKFGIKPISYDELTSFCMTYISSQSNSDEEDCVMSQATELQAPYIKFENANDRYRPIAKALQEWPRINLDKITPGESIFSFGSQPSTTSTTAAAAVPVAIQPPTPRQTNCTNTRQSSAQLQQQNQRHRRNIGGRTCDLCNKKFDKQEQLEEHLESKEHQTKVSETSWKDVENVIATLPSIESLANPRTAESESDENDRESFMCLTRFETIDDLFQIAAK